jgi:hypothetical protein
MPAVKPLVAVRDIAPERLKVLGSLASVGAFMVAVRDIAPERLKNAFLGSYKVGNCTQRRFSSCEGFLLPPLPQVRSPVSRKRFARSNAASLLSAAL